MFDYLRQRENYGGRRHAAKMVSADPIVQSFDSSRSIIHKIENTGCNPMYITGGIPPPFTLAWSNERMNGKLLAIGNEEGTVRIINTYANYNAAKAAEESKVKPYSSFTAHSNALFTLIWLNGDTQIATGSGDQSIRLHDVETSQTTQHLCGSGSVKSVDVRPDNPNLLVSGARDGKVFLWDVRVKEQKTKLKVPPGQSTTGFQSSPIQTFNEGESSRKARNIKTHSVTSVKCLDSNVIISGGDKSECVSFWDIRNFEKPVRNKNLEKPSKKKLIRDPLFKAELRDSVGRTGGISALVLDSTRTKLLVTVTNGKNYILNPSHIDQPAEVYHGHDNKSYYIKSSFSPDGNYIASGSMSGNVYIWKLGHSSKPMRELIGHASETSDVQWSTSDMQCLASCADDGSVRVWYSDLGKASLQKKNSTPVEASPTVDLKNWVCDPESITVLKDRLASQVIQKENSTPTFPALSPFCNNKTPIVSKINKVEEVDSNGSKKPSSTQKKTILHFFSPLNNISKTNKKTKITLEDNENQSLQEKERV